MKPGDTILINATARGRHFPKVVQGTVLAVGNGEITARFGKYTGLVTGTLHNLVFTAEGKRRFRRGAIVGITSNKEG